MHEIRGEAARDTERDTAWSSPGSFAVWFLVRPERQDLPLPKRTFPKPVVSLSVPKGSAKRWFLVNAFAFNFIILRHSFVLIICLSIWRQLPGMSNPTTEDQRSQNLHRESCCGRKRRGITVDHDPIGGCQKRN